MTIDVDVQDATAFSPLPDKARFRLWVETALQGKSDAELTLRLVDRDESRKLNSQYRGKDKPTNVLSFPMLTREELLALLVGHLVPPSILWLPRCRGFFVGDGAITAPSVWHLLL